MSESVNAPQLSGKLYLFEKPELLNREQHGALKLSRPSKPYGFCARARAIPLTIAEFPAAMKDYPIVFMSQENPIPLAITGLIDDVNLFVDDAGEWEALRYIPGYLRRYPFALANEASGDRMAIVIDADFEGFSVEGDIALFNGEEPGPETQQAIEFCKAFEQDRRISEEFGRRLNAMELIQSQTGEYTPTNGGEPRPFARYFGIDESKFNQLSDENILELKNNGMLPLIYAIMISTGNWRGLLQRRSVRLGLTDDEVVAPTVVN